MTNIKIVENNTETINEIKSQLQLESKAASKAIKVKPKTKKTSKIKEK